MKKLILIFLISVSTFAQYAVKDTTQSNAQSIRQHAVSLLQIADDLDANTYLLSEQASRNEIAIASHNVRLVQRGSWKREDYRYPEWKTDWRTWKNVNV